MNIFALDSDPVVAAQMMCDKHISKMIIESLQMLMSWYYQKNGITSHKQYKAEYSKVLALTNGFPREKPYRLGFPYHPCTQWLLESDANVIWLLKHTESLLNEYSGRFGKIHASHSIFLWFALNIGKTLDPTDLPTLFAMAMPNKYITSDPVLSYRLFYIHEKSRFAEWKRGRCVPRWYTYGLLLKSQGFTNNAIGYDLSRRAYAYE